MELTDKEIMDAMPKQLHEDLTKVCQMASDSIDVDVAGMFRVCLNRGIVDHCRAAIAAHQTAMPAFPPQELTDAQLLELAEKELCIDDMRDVIAAMRAAIAAHEAARIGLHCYLDDDGPCPSPCVFDDPAERISDCTYAQGLQRDGKPKTARPHYRAATVEAAPAPAPTPEEVEARFRAWWEESYPNAPAGGHAVRSHVAFALYLLGGEVQ